MEVLKFKQRSSADKPVRVRPARVYVNGARRRDLKVRTWEVLPTPQFGRVELVWHRAGARTSSLAGNSSLLPPIGSHVRVCCPLGPGGGEFIGLVSEHGVELGPDGEQLTAEVRHILTALTDAPVTGRWQMADGGVVHVGSGRVHFNANSQMLAGKAPTFVGGRATLVFDTADGNGRRWTVADALAYLLAIGVRNDVYAPTLAELRQLAGDIDAGSVNVTSMTVGEALSALAGRAGLDVRASRHGLGIVFYRSGWHGRRRSIRLQAEGSAFSPAGSNLWQGRVVIKPRPARPGVLALGEHKQYESTFALSPGWDASLQTSRWRDFVRGEVDNWPKVADVYRKWVLNEHGLYNDSPWNASQYDFSQINPSDFKLNVARKFLPCLSTDVFGQSLGVVIEIKGISGQWRRWTGPAWIHDDECGIYLGGEGLPADYFQAAVENNAEVRVTATVAADARLSVEAPGDFGGPREVADYSSQAAWRKVHRGSVLIGQDGTGAPAERDDTQMLWSLALRRHETLTSAVQAEIDLGWIDASCHVGDVIERVDGRALELSSAPGATAYVRSVKHDFGPSQTTHLEVSG